MSLGTRICIILNITQKPEYFVCVCVRERERERCSSEIENNGERGERDVGKIESETDRDRERCRVGREEGR